MGTKKKNSTRTGIYPFEFRLKVVKLFLEENYTAPMIAEEFGCHKSSITSWVRAYRKYGEQGLYTPSTQKNKAVQSLDSNLKSQIIELKKADPTRGLRRISDILKRFLCSKLLPQPSARLSMRRTCLILLRKNVARILPNPVVLSVLPRTRCGRPISVLFGSRAKTLISSVSLMIIRVISLLWGCTAARPLPTFLNFTAPRSANTGCQRKC